MGELSQFNVETSSGEDLISFVLRTQNVFCTRELSSHQASAFGWVGCFTDDVSRDL